MTDPILYTFRRCPYAIRARMALAQANISCELRELMLRDKPADMLAHSPKGTVPVLITSTGDVIDESLDVMLWALEQHDPDQWLSNPTEALDLINHYDQNFKPLLDQYKYADRYPEKTPVEHRQQTLPFIQDLNSKLTTHKFLLGPSMGLADVALFPFVRQYAFVDKTWFDQQSYPHLQSWLNDLLEMELFKQIMPKFKLFNDGFSYHFPAGDVIT